MGWPVGTPQRLDRSVRTGDPAADGHVGALLQPHHARAFRQLVGLSTGDYAELLIRGKVVTRSDEPNVWRKHIRRQARLDRLRIRTGESTRAPGIVWAIRLREANSSDDDEQAIATIAYQHDIEALARARNHRLERWIINHQGRAAGRCATRGARAYVDTTADRPVADGEVLDQDCPGY